MSKIQIVILAAGQGTRMKSETPKVFHSLGGRPVLFHVFDVANLLNPEQIILVASPQILDKPLPRSLTTVIQDPARGTGDAVKYALPDLHQDGYVLILFGDTPLITEATLKKMLQIVEKDAQVSLVVLGMEPDNPQQYARLIIDNQGHVTQIVEFKDLSSEQKAINLCNSGVMLVKSSLLHQFLPQIKPLNASQEYYLTDLVQLISSAGHICQYVLGEAEEFMGINTRADLAYAEAIYQNRWRQSALAQGVTLIDPSSVFFSYDSHYESDVIIHPFVIIGPGVTLKKGSQIFSFSQLSQTEIGEGARVGPFAHLRGHVTLEEGVQIGNFVEIKNSHFQKDSKAKHLSYIGDAEIGVNANIGAGTITCNYDGYKKSKTSIGKGAFIGSNSSLIAPVHVGDHAVVAAGSVVSENVDEYALAFGRARQVNYEQGAQKLRQKREKERK